MTPPNVRSKLYEPYTVSADQIRFFRENGFIKLKDVLSGETIAWMNKVITAEVERLNQQTLPIERRDTYGKAFLQVMNIWTKSEAVKEIVFSKRLAKFAADLMEVSGVRIYHDQALYKEPRGGHTPWHADQYYWPLASDKSITVWIPLQETPLSWGPLEFSAGSHQLASGRNLKISDESQDFLESQLKEKGFRQVVEPFSLGEVSYHAGWLFHRAAPNHSGQMRKVMTVIYMDRNMKLKAPENDNQIADWNTWCPGVKVGEVVNSALNPVLYEDEDF
ncbi:MAG: phytanoyl-CoA dioxygenase family protein [Bacteroidetes bacterium]|nr:phytanoyl-CoA dioxygenase family protein [Bacteroidota bacterium]